MVKAFNPLLRTKFSSLPVSIPLNSNTACPMKNLKLFLLFMLLQSGLGLQAQSFTSFFTGDTTDFITNDHQSGTLLAGGGPDSDAAMRWLLQRAGGGDILVLRASGSDGYNDYLFEDLGVNVNSVETIRFNDASAANDSYVLRRIAEAEAVFFAGGDQSVYVDYWRGTPVQDALNQLITEKGITLGGTSAGMAILSGIYYAPENQSLISVEALADPYHPNAEGISNQPFLNVLYLENTITDTHFEQRDRQGRSLVFLARAMELVGSQATTISANEASALAIDEKGIARAFGEFPTYGDYIFLLAPGCTDTPNGPETMQAGTPIEWNLNGRAVSVFVMPADEEGSNSFDLTSWSPLTMEGSWEYWTIQDQFVSFNTNGSEPAVCQPSSVRESGRSEITISPQPVRNQLFINGLNQQVEQLELLSSVGQRLLQIKPGVPSIDLSSFEPGIYFLRVRYRDGGSEFFRLIRS
ncbi:cyanophycinase [Lewinellaceae bacterium SD302]|nr:cyanophycinase [Lewinellaceae bacterium SD302]